MINRFGLILAASMAVALPCDAEQLSLGDILAGMRFERERIVSGVYTASGSEMPVRRIEKAEPVSLFSAFSFADQKMRFEHRGHGSVRRNGQLVEKDTRRIICLLPDRTYHFSDLSSSLFLNILPPGTLAFKPQPGTRGFLDVRTLGILESHEAYRGMSLEKAIDRWEQGWTAEETASGEPLPDPSISQDESGVTRVSLTTSGGRRSFWVNTDKGFTLERYRVELGKVNAATGEFNSLSDVVADNPELAKKLSAKNMGDEHIIDVAEEIEMEWTCIKDVWVPTSYEHFFATQKLNDSKAPNAPPLKVVRNITKLALDWKSVNETVADEVFDYRSFDLPKGTEVFDRRGENPLFIEKIGVTPPRARNLAKKSDKPDRRWLVLANLAMICGFVGYVWYRRR